MSEDAGSTAAIQRQRLKFAEEHVDRILGGQKRATIRLDPDGELRVGDVMHLCTEDGERFASARISDRGYQDAEWLVRLGVDGHKSYRSTEQFLEEMSEYYPEAELGPETCFEIVYWDEVWQ